MPGNVRPVVDECDGLLAFLAQQHDALKVAAFGLTPEQLRSSPTASVLTVGGLLKHVAITERGWLDTIAAGGTKGDVDEREAAYHDTFQLEETDTLELLLADLDAALAETRGCIAQVADLDQPVPVPPAPWFPKDVEAWSVRWVLLHLIEEVARHAGHADVVRESIDGATAYALMAAAEGWPETTWLKPWSPS